MAYFLNDLDQEDIASDSEDEETNLEEMKKLKKLILEDRATLYDHFCNANGQNSLSRQSSFSSFRTAPGKIMSRSNVHSQDLYVMCNDGLQNFRKTQEEDPYVVARRTPFSEKILSRIVPHKGFDSPTEAPYQPLGTPRDIEEIKSEIRNEFSPPGTKENLDDPEDETSEWLPPIDNESSRMRSLSAIPGRQSRTSLYYPSRPGTRGNLSRTRSKSAAHFRANKREESTLNSTPFLTEVPLSQKLINKEAQEEKKRKSDLRRERSSPVKKQHEDSLEWKPKVQSQHKFSMTPENCAIWKSRPGSFYESAQVRKAISNDSTKFPLEIISASNARKRRVKLGGSISNDYPKLTDNLESDFPPIKIKAARAKFKGAAQNAVRQRRNGSPTNTNLQKGNPFSSRKQVFKGVGHASTNSILQYFVSHMKEVSKKNRTASKKNDHQPFKVDRLNEFIRRIDLLTDPEPDLSDYKGENNEEFYRNEHEEPDTRPDDPDAAYYHWKNRFLSTQFKASDDLSKKLESRERARKNVLASRKMTDQVMHRAMKRAQRLTLQKDTSISSSSSNHNNSKSIWIKPSKDTDEIRENLARGKRFYYRLRVYLDFIGAPFESTSLVALEYLRKVLMEANPVNSELLWRIIDLQGESGVQSHEMLKILHFIKVDVGVSTKEMIQYIQKKGWELTDELKSMKEQIEQEEEEERERKREEYQKAFDSNSYLSVPSGTAITTEDDSK